MNNEQASGQGRGRNPRARYPALKLQLGLVLFALIATPFLGAWGQNGHRIVGEIAERYLSPRARAAVDRLLEGQSLAEVSTWADEIRSDDRWACATPFHYVTVPVDTTYPDPERREWEDGDAIRAVVFLAERLTQSDADPAGLRDALRFLVHVVGDLHQPLHVGRGCDRGGNDLTVQWFGQERRLHAVWDEALIESENLSYTEYTGFLDRPSRLPPASVFVEGPLTWISEAQSLQRDVYRCNTSRDRCPCFCGDCEDGLSEFGGCAALAGCQLQIEGPVRLGFAYKARVKQQLDQGLLRSGLRLAALLNTLFAEQPDLPPPYRELRAELNRIEGWDSALNRCFTGAD